MIGHEYEGMNVTSPAPRRTAKERQVSQAIFLVDEASLAIVTAPGDVLRDANKIEPARPEHDQNPL